MTKEKEVNGAKTPNLEKKSFVFSNVQKTKYLRLAEVETQLTSRLDEIKQQKIDLVELSFEAHGINEEEMKSVVSVNFEQNEKGEVSVLYDVKK
jgi:hypothetical protein